MVLKNTVAFLKLFSNKCLYQSKHHILIFCTVSIFIPFYGATYQNLCTRL